MPRFMMLLSTLCVVIPVSEAFIIPRQAAAGPIESLKLYLAKSIVDRGEISEQDFALTALTRKQAGHARQLIWDDFATRVKSDRVEEANSRRITIGDYTLKYGFRVFGDKPADGRSLYISMHGGGGAPARVNDRQWENQKRLYTPKEGVYLAPRAPSDKWNLWHRSHIDPLYDRLITNMVVFEDVNPNRVYIMGYSAGGDGVFQLAPRMADRWAAAAMMAGHPNETSPLGLRNLPFTLHMGGQDAAYKRNRIAVEWKQKLAELRQADTEGYEHLVMIYPNKGHWMDREDASAVAWMAQFRRRQHPKKVVWKQDDVTHDRFYWLAIPPRTAEKRKEVRATLEAQQIDLESEAATVIVRLNDEMLDLDEDITITARGQTLMSGKVDRTINVIAKTIEERGDPGMVFAAEVAVNPDS